MKGIFKWIIVISFVYCCMGLTAEIPRVPLEAKVIEGSSDSTSVRSLKSFFKSGSTTNKAISLYNLEGINPCIIHEPQLSLMELFSYRSNGIVIDFDVVDSRIYYLSNYKVYSLDLTKFANNEMQDPKELFNVMPYNFSYMSVFTFSNSDTVFLFKSTDSRFSYISMSGIVNEPVTVQTTESLFEEFTEQMKITVYHDFIFIPAGAKGVLVYKYDTTKRTITRITTFAFAEDARDITVKEVKNDLIGVVADYNKGIISFSITAFDMTVSNIKTWQEFVNVRSVTWITKGENNKLLLIMSALGGSSKYVVLTMEFESGLKFSYDQMKLLDGVANYGDTNDEYAAITMPNSIMILEITEKGDSMAGYVNNQDMNHARIQKVEGKLGSWLVSASDSNLHFTNLITTQGYLLCYAGSESKSYNFTILGRSSNCGVNSEQVLIRDCYYQVNVTFQIVNREFYERIWQMEMIGVLILLAIIAVVAIVLAFVIRRYIKTKNALMKYEQLQREQEAKNAIQVT